MIRNLQRFTANLSSSSTSWLSSRFDCMYAYMYVCMYVYAYATLHGEPLLLIDVVAVL